MNDNGSASKISRLRDLWIARLKTNRKIKAMDIKDEFELTNGGETVTLQTVRQARPGQDEPDGPVTAPEMRAMWAIVKDAQGIQQLLAALDKVEMVVAKFGSLVRVREVVDELRGFMGEVKESGGKK